MYISHGLLLEMVLQKKSGRGKGKIFCFFREFSLRPLLSPAKEIERSKGQQKSYLDPPPSLLSISCAGRCVSHFDPPHTPTPPTPHTPTKVQRRRTSGQTFFSPRSFFTGMRRTFFCKGLRGGGGGGGGAVAFSSFSPLSQMKGKGSGGGIRFSFCNCTAVVFPDRFS